MSILLTPEECCLALIDHQPQMLFAVGSHDRSMVINNVVGLAKTAKAFQVPTILSTVGAKHFAGPLLEGLQEVFPEQTPIDRSTMNAWEDQKFVEAIQATGRKTIIMAGLWTEICLVFPVLDAINEGFEVAFVADASGGETLEAHQLGCERMIQAGAIPLTWVQIMAEWQRDWARSTTSHAVQEIAKQHIGAYGQGLIYAQSMFGQKEGSSTKGTALKNPENRPQH